MMRFRHALAATLLLTTAAVSRDHPAAQTKAAVAKALADPARTDQAKDDDRRHAAAVLAFSGVGPGDAVVDYFPGSGYWTRAFTNIVGAKGRVYAIWPKAGEKYAAKALPALKARGFANVLAEVQTTDLPTAPKPVDLFWTVQNYHDVANENGEASLTAFDAAVFKMLKPGGTYVVIDHVDAAGTGISGTDTRHRIDPAAVRKHVEAAGFKFVGESNVLRNPADDHSKAVFDDSIRGRTDQFVYKFRKPG